LARWVSTVRGDSVQRPADLLVGQAFNDQAQHLALAGSRAGRTALAAWLVGLVALA
jgi:hypothetical protein